MDVNSAAKPIEAKKKRVENCRDFAMGKCRHGKGCNNGDHPQMLDAGLEGQWNEGEEFAVSTEGSTACFRCLQQGKECDKAGRGGPEDPCSECRQYAGDANQPCVLNQGNYNDSLWHIMMRTMPAGRLPQWKNSEYKPMPAHKVKADWKGFTVAQLQARGDWLPAYVRERPRVYLSPPGLSSNKARKKEYGKRLDENKTAEQGRGLKRSREDEPVTASSSTTLPTRSMDLAIEMPGIQLPRHYGPYGAVKRLVYDADGDGNGATMKVTFENGLEVKMPAKILGT